MCLSATIFPSPIIFEECRATGKCSINSYRLIEKKVKLIFQIISMLCVQSFKLVCDMYLKLVTRASYFRSELLSQRLLKSINTIGSSSKSSAFPFTTPTKSLNNCGSFLFSLNQVFLHSS